VGRDPVIAHPTTRKKRTTYAARIIGKLCALLNFYFLPIGLIPQYQVACNPKKMVAFLAYSGQNND
jgi:hypothetical protein